LAPIARQSGRWIGKAFIRGGRANVRQALYMPALVAITTIMRKLVVLANALLKAGRPWIPKTA
jgi:transposase